MNDIAPPTTTSTAPKVAWYFNVSLVQVLLIFLFPVGFTLMWFGRVFSARTRWIVTGFLGLFIVSLMSSKAPQRGADLAVSPNVVSSASPEPLRIIATVDQFKDAIPLLRRLPMDMVTRDGATEYGWRDVSTIGNHNAVRIYDLGGDGRLDWLLATVVVQNERKDSNMESFMLALRLISVAGGSTSEEAASVISAWIPKAVAKGGDTRRFGTVDVNASFSKASDGGVLIICIIGTEEGRAVVLGKPAVGSKVAPSPDAAPVITISALKLEQGIVSHDRLPDPRTLSAEARAAEDARITAAIAAAKSAVDAQEKPDVAKTEGVVTAFRRDATALTDLLRKQALSEPSALEAHAAATRIQKLVLGNTEWVLQQGNRSGVEAAPSEFVRDDTRATIGALRALIDRSSVAYLAGDKVQERRSGDLLRVIADLEAQRPALRLEKMEAASLTRMVKLNEEALALAQEITASTAQPPSIQSRAALVAWLDEKEKLSASDRQQSGKILAEKVLPLTARVRAEATAAVGLPKSEEATRMVMSRLDDLAQTLRQQSEFDMKSVIDHHRALLASLPISATPQSVATAAAAIKADRAAHQDRWTAPGFTEAWSGVVDASVRDAASDAGLAALTLAGVIDATKDIWRINPTGAQAGRYQPLLVALSTKKAVTGASSEDGLAALAALESADPLHTDRFGVLVIAIEDAVGLAQVKALGERSLGAVNAWSETRRLDLTGETRQHHIDLLNRLGANAAGMDVANMKKTIEADYQRHAAMWDGKNGLMDTYRALQVRQYRTFLSRMRTKPEVVTAAIQSFNRGIPVNWSTIDADDARAMAELGSEGLSADSKPWDTGFWGRAADKLQHQPASANASSTPSPPPRTPPSTAVGVPGPAAPVEDPLFK